MRQAQILDFIKITIWVLKREFKPCSNCQPNEQYINSKIYEANTLIDRVKDTLHEIKNNAKIIKDLDAPVRLSVNKETCTEETFVGQVVYDPAQTSQNDESEVEYYRPRTRRNDLYVVHQLRLDKGKFQNMADDKLDEDVKAEEITSLECLQIKLNTISEQAESDLSSSNSEPIDMEEEKVTSMSEQAKSDLLSSSNSEPKVETKEKGKTTVTTCCNTESVILQSQETQVQPEVKSSGTQFFKDILDGTTQTDKEAKKPLNVENRSICEIIQPPLATTKQLIVQILPPIDITGDLVLQKIYQLSIGPDEMTHVHYKSEKKNVGYFETFRDEVFETKLSILDVKKKMEILKKIEEHDHTDSNEDLNCDVGSTASRDVFIYRDESNNEEGSNETVYKKGSLAIKEMFYKSFQLLDNPNKHDPGDVPHDMDITTMDTSVYKTFINPEGFPETLSDIDQKSVKDNRGNFKRKISLISAVPLVPKADRQINLDALKQKSSSMEPSISELESSRKEVNSKLWDIGLYCSKSVQCCPTVDTKNIDKPPIRQETKDTSSRIEKPVITTSYDEISLTISYSTDTTTDSSTNTDNNKRESTTTEDMEKHMLPINPEPRAQNSSKDEPTLSSFSRKASYNKKTEYDKIPQDKSAPTKLPPYKTAELEKLSQDINMDNYKSVSRQVSHHRVEDEKVVQDRNIDQGNSVLRKIPHYNKNEYETENINIDQGNSLSIKTERENLAQDIHIDETDIFPAPATSKPAAQKSCHSVDFIDLPHSLRPSEDSEVSQFITTLTNTKSDELKKVIPKVRRSPKDTNHDYTALPLQIHGDYWPSEYHKRNPHLRLGDNGRYKDEEHMFCKKSYSNLEDIALRCRALRSFPRYYYKKYTLDKANNDSVTMDETMSEGEIKCRCNGSIGEIHRCKSMFPENKKQPQFERRSFKDEAGGTVRERRTYFNHWITYYVDKKVPSVNDSSSTSNST